MEKDKKDLANSLAKEIIQLAKENEYDDGSVLAAGYILSLSDTGTPRS